MESFKDLDTETALVSGTSIPLNAFLFLYFFSEFCWIFNKICQLLQALFLSPRKVISLIFSNPLLVVFVNFNLRRFGLGFDWGTTPKNVILSAQYN